MFITDQHRKQIRQFFAEMDRHIDVLEKLTALPRQQFMSDVILQSAAERSLHLALECATDVGNLIIDALIMRDPSSYEDIIQVLADEKLFPSEFADFFMQVVKFRRVLAHDYLERDVAQLYQMVVDHAGDFRRFQEYVSEYVEL
ncbi:type VII toxin-antitoxin system HepT family RNase toxin [Effusibacillus dendaii]|uniref:DUF86 domain-containing protein n=1 Tax=Effusibacillus dendaii TaxID=2743772 RepID=A0A7I8DAP4_9BACL|nr:DUF86 domain-containing protein [Effusibacillus dendaii]BCJ86422.1 hypothetical protein skT53_14070 [Effusibacillus dendaii]